MPNDYAATPRQQELIEQLGELNPDAMIPDGFESCIVGIARRCGMEPLALIDVERCIDVLIKRDGMDDTEAREFFEFNVLESWIGNGSPIFLVASCRCDTTDDAATAGV